MACVALPYTAAHAQPSGAPAPASRNQMCPAPVPYPSDDVVRRNLVPGKAARVAPSYRRFLDSLAANGQRDSSNLCRFRAENMEQARKGRPSVVMIGDSITESWLSASPELRAAGFVNRGISNQTSGEVRARFRQDVIALRPSVVHVLVGTNNIAGIGRPFDRKTFESDIRAIVELSKAALIALIIGSILPVNRYPWSPDLVPENSIRNLNAWLRDTARSNDATFVDYYRAFTISSRYMPDRLTNDGVHPNIDGYRVMTPLLVSATRTARGTRH